ncbi:MAG TPA: M3 family metallopeptidase [Candidatus Eisenbacteria bacterium]|nr:M3 family metallopeptidase [Candidatus Eisenbacteria bacterium]
MRRMPSPATFQTVRAAAFVLAAALCLLAPAAPAARADDQPLTRDGIAASTKTHLDRAQAILDEMLAVKGQRTSANTLEKMNDLSIELNGAADWAGLMENVHPDSSVRAAAEKATQDIQAFETKLSLNHDAYVALQAVDVTKADPITQRHWRLLLRDYRRSGVDKDEATRKKIQDLNEELVKIGQDFDRNIRDGERYVYVDKTDLDGLAPDYVQAHQPDSTGKIKITTDYPDFIPFITYSKSGEARRRLYVEFMNRAYPQNKAVLEKLIAKRNELATTLGYKSWAEYITEDKMSRSPKRVEEFIEQLDEATKRRADQDYAMLLARKKRDDPKATSVADWERRYYAELVKNEKYDFDAQTLRPYFNFPNVEKGILDMTSKMFGVTYKKVDGVAVWMPEVETYDVYDGTKLIGRFFLDMHPRDGKYTHAAAFPIQTGVEGRVLPEACLVCNLPRPDSKGVGLMEQDDVETFLHEFGHLLHGLFAGHQHWADRSGISTEWDFVEAPSQMLEEWVKDPGALQTFAHHYQTGEPIPAALIAKLRAANEFGNGLYVRQQNFYSAISLHYYDRDPKNVDLDKQLQDNEAKYSPWQYVPDTHMYASFDHLEGYSAIYYTYMWSLVIAKDMFSKFDQKNLLDPKIATEYRHKVLEPGGTQDAADLVKNFLGRPYNFKAFEAWLNRGAGT